METITRDTDRDFFMSPQEAIEVGGGAGAGRRGAGRGRGARGLWPATRAPPPHPPPTPSSPPLPPYLPAQYGLVDAIIAKPQLYEARGTPA
jgi:hypothetical protein